MRKRVQAKDRTISPHLDEKTSHYQRERIKSLHRFIKLPLLPHKNQFLNHSLSLSLFPHTPSLTFHSRPNHKMQALVALTYINQARTWSPAPTPPLGARCFQLLTPKRQGDRFARKGGVDKAPKTPAANRQPHSPHREWKRAESEWRQ